MTVGRRLPANLATLANAAVGVGAILYVLAGNKLWAVLLVVAGVGFDGIDGFLARRAHLDPSPFGRVADSVADAITFGLAPAALVMVHTDRPNLWQPYGTAAFAVGGLVAGLALARLAYFTWRGYRHPDFRGVPTPTNALAVVLVVLFFDVPAFAGVAPALALTLAAVLALLMVVPVPFPKLKRGHRLSGPMTLTAVAFVVAVLPLQFRPTSGSGIFDLAESASVIAAVGMAIYYLGGPFTVSRTPSAE